MDVNDVSNVNIRELKQRRRLRKRHLQNLNSRCLKLNHAYSISFNSSNIGIFSGAEFLKTLSKFRKRKRKLLSFVD